MHATLHVTMQMNIQEHRDVDTVGAPVKRHKHLGPGTPQQVVPQKFVQIDMEITDEIAMPAVCRSHTDGGSFLPVDEAVLPQRCQAKKLFLRHRYPFYGVSSAHGGVFNGHGSPPVAGRRST